MQVFESSCCVLVHVGSSIVNRMNHLNYLLLHCYHAYEWCQPSTDAQWVSCACNWLVFAGISESKGLCSGQTYGMPCIGIVSLGTGTLQDEQNHHTCYTYLCFLISQSRVKALLVLVWWFLLYTLVLHLFLLG